MRRLESIHATPIQLTFRLRVFVSTPASTTDSLADIRIVSAILTSNQLAMQLTSINTLASQTPPRLQLQTHNTIERAISSLTGCQVLVMCMATVDTVPIITRMHTASR